MLFEVEVLKLNLKADQEIMSVFGVADTERSSDRTGPTLFLRLEKRGWVSISSSVCSRPSPSSVYTKGRYMPQ